ncbi:SKA3 protein, partial [Todus mexicanus]|nr:SKA3 protein [Todus mexicanus]
DYEDESPIRVLHDLHCEIRTLKEDVNASLRKCSSEKQEIHDFMKASEILMQRNAADLGKIRELFKKYGYKSNVKESTEEKEEVVNGDSTVSVQNKSDEEKADIPHPPTCTEKSKDPLRDPRLSDFGLSQYAFSRPWSAVKGQRSTNAYQENSKIRTPLKTQSPCILAKTPKCMLKMDDYECVTPKIEHFGISEHTICMNEDYTISLLNKTAPTSKSCKKLLNHSVKIPHCRNNVYSLMSLALFPSCLPPSPPYPASSLLPSPSPPPPFRFLLVKKENHEVKVPEMASREVMVTPGTKPKAVADNAHWMASPMVLVFCTPDVTISSRTNSVVLSRSPETNELPPPSHTETPHCPDFQTRWLKKEIKVVNSNCVHFHSLFNINEGFSVSVWDSFTVLLFLTIFSDEYLKHLGDPSPPKIKPYDQLLSTPPPPEITRIPDDVLQLLSKYNHKVDSSKAKEMETKAGKSTRHESEFGDCSNKENR